MNKAKQVVETWGRQFHCAPREQRLAFLYLANDILQNSRRKGAEFVAEFWKVLPDSLRDVIEHGDGAAKSAALRLVYFFLFFLFLRFTYTYGYRENISCFVEVSFC